MPAQPVKALSTRSALVGAAWTLNRCSTLTVRLRSDEEAGAQEPSRQGPHPLTVPHRTACRACQRASSAGDFPDVTAANDGDVESKLKVAFWCATASPAQHDFGCSQLNHVTAVVGEGTH